MFSVNQKAVQIVKEKILPFSEELNVRVHVLKNGATVVDMGVNAGGGFKAAKYFIEATIGGLGEVVFGHYAIGEHKINSCEVFIDNPREATLASQFSGWKLAGEGLDINPIGSGPARAIAKNDIFSQCVSYQDIHHEVVFGAQTTIMPDEAVAESVAEACKVKPENVYILAARTGSLVGGFQVCSRTVEATMWRLSRKGFDIETVISGSGFCPVPPQTLNELHGMDRVNTALLYGASVSYVVDWEDEKIAKIIKELPLSASTMYGTSFMKVFEEGDRDFYKVNKDVHTIARYTIANQRSGRTFSAGIIREDMMIKSFF
jgi:methenyltetrahydromethanopterin cyclohydrolase